MTPSKLTLALSLATACVAAACDDTPTGPTPPAVGGLPKPAEAAPPPPEPEVEAPEIAYAYTPVGKRDPFRSLFERVEVEDKAITELQRFQLDQLKVVAIVTGRATPYAMVEDPNGNGHTLTRGTLVGKNWGRVAQITNECVVVREEYRDYTGRKVTNELNMCLPKPDALKVD